MWRANQRKSTRQQPHSMKYERLSVRLFPILKSAFNSIEKLQSRTRLTLALLASRKRATDAGQIREGHRRPYKTLASFNVDERHYWISTFYTLLINASLRREKAIYFTPPRSYST